MVQGEDIQIYRQLLSPVHFTKSTWNNSFVSLSLLCCSANSVKTRLFSASPIIPTCSTDMSLFEKKKKGKKNMRLMNVAPFAFFSYNVNESLKYSRELLSWVNHTMWQISTIKQRYLLLELVLLRLSHIALYASLTLTLSSSDNSSCHYRKTDCVLLSFFFFCLHRGMWWFRKQIRRFYLFNVEQMKQFIIVLRSSL